MYIGDTAFGSGKRIGTKGTNGTRRMGFPIIYIKKKKNYRGDRNKRPKRPFRPFRPNPSQSKNLQTTTHNNNNAKIIFKPFAA
jgi:hypothetical protein